MKLTIELNDNISEETLLEYASLGVDYLYDAKLSLIGDSKCTELLIQEASTLIDHRKAIEAAMRSINAKEENK